MGSGGAVDLIGVGEVGGVGAAFDLDERDAVAESVAECLRLVHRDRGIGGAVRDERRTRDLADPVGDVVST